MTGVQTCALPICKTNVSTATFLKRKDKYTFYKLSRKYSGEELRNFYIANLLKGDKWVGDMLKDGEEIYQKWLKIQQSLGFVPVDAWKLRLITILSMPVG